MRTDPWVLIAGGFHKSGGMDKANFALAEHLTSNGTAVHLVAHTVDDTLRANSLVTCNLVPRPLNSYILGEPWLDWKGRQVARHVTARWPGTTVVVNGGNCAWPGVNWSHYIHHAWNPKSVNRIGLSAAAKAITKRTIRVNERHAYQRARLVIANSNVTNYHIRQHFSLPQDRVKTLYLGSDASWGPATAAERHAARASLGLSDSRPTAIFLGALGTDRRKGIDTLLAAWKSLCDDNQWDVDLLAAGDGRELPFWRSEINSWGLHKTIRLLGFRGDVRNLLAASDILISPTRYEAYGLNVQEAICRGVPSLVSASAGIAERYPVNLKMFLVPDPENIGDLVGRLKLWRSRMQISKSEFEPFGRMLRSNSWQNMAGQFVSLAQGASSSKYNESAISKVP